MWHKRLILWRSQTATGGLAYLGKLAANTPSSAHIQRHVDVVMELSI